MKKLLIYSLVFCCIAISYGGCKKIKECPDEWIVDMMPTTEDKPADEYLIYNGQRVEINMVDTAWVNKNCDIKKKIVQ